MPRQVPSWHMARLPVQFAAEQLGTHAPPPQLPPGQLVPGAALTQTSATHTLQGPGQLVAVQLGGSAIWQRPSRQTGVSPVQASLRLSQAPAAVHTLATRVVPEQLAAPQALPAGSRRHPPLPSHPFVHESSPHTPAGSAPPAGTLAQVPSCPGRLQALQVPMQSLLQQRPCAQKLLAQSAPWLHVAPMPRFPHEPPAHTPWAHCESLPQAVAQWLPVQPR